jgi:nitroreductase
MNTDPYLPLPAMQHIPEKPAATDLPVIDPIVRRWSPVIFSGQPIDLKTIATLFEASRWAPSSFNEQPWRYVYATKDDGEQRAKLESLLMDGNTWAKDAYLLLISFTRKKFARNAKENRHAMHDLGAASGFLTLQAVSMGLMTHQMAGFHVDKANETLGVPADFVPGSMMAVGYSGDIAGAKPDMKERDAGPRQRNEQQKFAFHGKWEA